MTTGYRSRRRGLAQKPRRGHLCTKCGPRGYRATDREAPREEVGKRDHFLRAARAGGFGVAFAIAQVKKAHAEKVPPEKEFTLRQALRLEPLLG